MKRYQKEATHRMQIADHLLCQTYPYLKDSRLLLASAEHIFHALMNALNAYTNQQESIDFENKLESAKKEGVPEKHLKNARELKEVLRNHRKSPIEISHKEKFVIYDEGYNMKTLTYEVCSRYLEDVKELVKKIECKND